LTHKGRNNTNKQKFRKKPIIEVYTTAFLEKTLNKLNKVKIIAVDFEYDPTYRYVDRLCLIQIGTLQQIYLIDPLSTKLNVQLLKPLFENPAIVKVFHDAQQDILLIKKALNIHPKSIFDTSIASRVLGIPQPSLKNLIDKFFQLKISKQQSRAEWGQRPLTKEMIYYAANDVRYLVELYNIFHSELFALNSLEEVGELFELLETKIPDVMEFNPNSFLALPRARELNPSDLALLKALYLWREMKAMRLQENPFFILPNSALFKLVELRPKSKTELKDSLREIRNHYNIIQKYGNELLNTVKQGIKADPIDLTEITTTKKFINKTREAEQQALEESFGEKIRRQYLKRLNTQLALESGKEASVIIPKAIQQQLSRENPSQINQVYEQPGFGKWRIKQYGTAIIKALQDANSELLCNICQKPFEEATVYATCPHCQIRFHVKEVIDLIEESKNCPKCEEPVYLD
jgi:ribonuclease D